MHRPSSQVVFLMMGRYKKGPATAGPQPKYHFFFGGAGGAAGLVYCMIRSALPAELNRQTSCNSVESTFPSLWVSISVLQNNTQSTNKTTHNRTNTASTRSTALLYELLRACTIAI